MKADVELRLTHDGHDWIGENPDVHARGETLHELDENVRSILLQSGKYQAGRRLMVFMGFDFETIPTWLRQYHNHYFNRYIEVQL